MSREEGEHFAREHDMPYIETSALDGHNINEAFKLISNRVYENIKIGSLVPNAEVSNGQTFAR